MRKLRRKFKAYVQQKSLSSQLTALLLAVFVPVVIFLVCFFVIIAVENGRYAKMLQNVTVAGEFGSDFKDNLDLNMYYYIIGNQSVTEVPKGEVDRAREIVARLEKTTSNPLNRQLLKKIDALCNSLEQGMDIICEKELYDDKIYELENNIYVLTEMIEDSIREYAYRESMSLEELQRSVNSIVTKAEIGFGVCAALLLLAAAFTVYSYIKNIERTISKMRGNVKKIGDGDFNIRHIEPFSSDLKILSDGIEMMAERLSTLMERVKTEQTALYQAELMLMQAQINPHFLYNTLDTIVWLAEDGQNRKVIDMVQSLSTFFRTCLSKGQDIITVKEAESHTESYLKIQRIRYSDILEYNIDIDNDIYDYEIPKLVLQPLVENSLYHGIKNKRGGGKIEVLGRKEGDELVFDVVDNGAGMTEERLKELNKSLSEKGSIGFGVKNVNERIRLYYGDKYGLRFESVFGEWTRVCLRIPAKFPDKIITIQK